jgi:GNAT superfamily N-acetyltransferase
VIDTLCEIKREASMAGFAHIFDPPGLYPYPEAETRAGLEELLARDAQVVLDPQQRGYALVADEWLHQLFVRPAAWGTGVADELHDHATDFGARQLWVMEQNARARRFYEKHGWRPDGRTRVVPFPPHPVSLGYSLP